MAPEAKVKNALVWFRKGLRLHDNPALVAAIAGAHRVLPVFCLDPAYIASAVMKVGSLRWAHLLESLSDLDDSFRERHSRLLVVRGDPLQVFPSLLEKWKITHVYFEEDTEPYAIFRDDKVRKMCQTAGIECHSSLGHTLWAPAEVVKANKGKAPLTYRGFQTVIEKMPKPKPALDAPKEMPAITDEDAGKLLLDSPVSGPAETPFSVPTLGELRLKVPAPDKQSPHKGGEKEALRRLDAFLADASRAAKFEKPETSPAMMYPSASTTVLSPYLKFGSLSARLFYRRLVALYASPQGKGHSQPPVSLMGQLLWREFYYAAATTPGYELMATNPVCLQVPWRLQGAGLPKTPDAEEKKALAHLDAWKSGRTGFPWIDAIMRQLRQEGWIHHLARHSVACFLTRGDLYISWERGAEVFEELLLDADPALNIGNWLWLSASAYFSQYFRVYSPVAFPNKYKPEALKYIRKYVPELASVPDKFVIEPWLAPADVKKTVREKGYPDPIVDHKEASKVCIEGLAAAYKAKKYGVPPTGNWVPPVVDTSAGVEEDDDKGEGEDKADEDVPVSDSNASAETKKRTILDFFGGPSSKKSKTEK